MADGILNPVEQLEAEFDFDVYTKQEVDTLLDEKADKSDTYTKTETDALLDDKADADSVYTKTETNDLLNGKADKSTTLAGYGITDAYTKTETDNLLNGKADTNSVYTKEETDNLLSVKANSADVYTKTETNNLLSAKADSANVYTKTEADTLLAGKADTNNVYTKTEIDNQLTVTKDGTWVKGTQTTATNLEKLEGGIEYLYGLLSYKYSQLRKYINGNYYDYETDTDSAYTKTVPSGAMPYAGLERIGGKTLVWNQLGDFGTLVWESGSSKQFAFTQGTPLYAGHKYYFCGTIASETNVDVRLYTRQNDTNQIEGRIYRDTPATIFTATNNAVSNGTNAGGNGNIWLYTNVSSGDSATNIMLIDLTLLYGAGNEPTTVEQFREMFPADYYPYNAGELLSAGVTEVVSKKADTTTIATYSVPAEIQSLEGYGWSVDIVPNGTGTYIPCYNYVDYENKKFVQKIFRHIFTGQADDVISYVGIATSASNITFLSFRVKGDYVHKTGNNGDAYNIVADRFQRRSFENISYGTYNNCYAIQGNWNVAFALRIEGFTTLAEYQTYLASNPLTLQWELATPIETDISAYLSDDNLIEVEAGGTLTFPNSNGDDYRIPVPSEETYMINLQEAVSNG